MLHKHTLHPAIRPHFWQQSGQGRHARWLEKAPGAYALSALPPAWHAAQADPQLRRLRPARPFIVKHLSFRAAHSVDCPPSVSLPGNPRGLAMGCRSVRLLGCCTLLVLGYMMHDYCGSRVRRGAPSVASPEPEPVPRDSECSTLCWASSSRSGGVSGVTHSLQSWLGGGRRARRRSRHSALLPAGNARPSACLAFPAARLLAVPGWRACHQKHVDTIAAADAAPQARQMPRPAAAFWGSLLAGFAQPALPNRTATSCLSSAKNGPPPSYASRGRRSSFTATASPRPGWAPTCAAPAAAARAWTQFLPAITPSSMPA